MRPTPGTLVWGTTAKDGTPPVRVESAFPAIVTVEEFQRVKRLLKSRSPKTVHPRRAASPYLLSGLATCALCGKLLTAAEAKSGKYTYYVCQSIIKSGSGSCETPRINAKLFEETIIRNLRENVLSEGNIRSLVQALDEEMDGLAHEQRGQMDSIESELEDVKRRLARLWNIIETTDMEMADAAERVRELRDRREKLEQAASAARAIVAERRAFLDRAETVAAFAADMSEFLRTSELTETRSFIRSFVKEIQIRPGKASIIYTIPLPEDSPIGGVQSTELPLSSDVRSTILGGGAEGIRTPDPLLAKQVLSRLSYDPTIE